MDGATKEFWMIKLVWEGPGAREDQYNFGRTTMSLDLRYEVQTIFEDGVTYFDCQYTIYPIHKIGTKGRYCEQRFFLSTAES